MHNRNTYISEVRTEQDDDHRTAKVEAVGTLHAVGAVIGLAYVNAVGGLRENGRVAI